MSFTGLTSFLGVRYNLKPSTGLTSFLGMRDVLKLFAGLMAFLCVRDALTMARVSNSTSQMFIYSSHTWRRPYGDNQTDK